MNRVSFVFLGVAALSICGCSTVDKDHKRWANRMMDSTNSMVPTTPLSVEREISVKEAYEIQKVFDAKMSKKYGDVTGYKVAYASKASQKAWNITAPTFGTLFEDQLIENGGSTEADDYILFFNESEIAFKMGADVKTPIKSVDELMPFIGSVHVGFDIPDQRFDPKKGKIGVADAIALSCASKAYMIGDGVDPKGLDYENITVSMSHNEQTVYEGAASNVMGDPRLAVVELVNHLLEQGTFLKKGDVVLSGAVAGAYCPKTEEARKGVYVGTATGFPSIKLIVE